MTIFRHKIISLIKSFILIGMILFVLVEFTGRILAYFKILPRGISPVISIFANENYSLWHPENIMFIHHYNTCWEPSKVYFNNIGARGKKDVYLKKNKPRIALIGDSMIEEINITEGLDLASLLRKKLPNYEIINFSSRGMGMADMSDLYRHLVRKYNVDYIFLFITENDIENNFYKGRKTHQRKFNYDMESQSIIKYNRNEIFFKNYYSNLNKFKRSNFILNIKKYSYSFRIYYQFRMILKNMNLEKDDGRSKDFLNEELLFKKTKVYEYIVDEFIKLVEKDNVRLISFLNIRSYLFEKKINSVLKLNQRNRLKNFEIVSSEWKKYKIINPFDSAIEYLKKNNIYEPPWLGRKCDDHYSEIGVEFLSTFVVDKFNKLKNH